MRDETVLIRRELLKQIIHLLYDYSDPIENEFLQQNPRHAERIIDQITKETGVSYGYRACSPRE